MADRDDAVAVRGGDTAGTKSRAIVSQIARVSFGI